MATGPGKYDDLCVAAMAAAGASTAVLIIMDGVRGSGFSINGIDRARIHLIPRMLRDVAKQIEQDLKRMAS